MLLMKNGYLQCLSGRAKQICFLKIIQGNPQNTISSIEQKVKTITLLLKITLLPPCTILFFFQHPFNFLKAN